MLSGSGSGSGSAVAVVLDAGAPTPPPTTDEACVQVGARIADIVISSTPDPTQKAAYEQERTKLVKRFAENCQKDAWPEKVRTCFMAAKTPSDIEVCSRDLTKPAPPPPPNAGSGSAPPAGSGSAPPAGSGSAPPAVKAGSGARPPAKAGGARPPAKAGSGAPARAGSGAANAGSGVR